jgi:5-methylcytosine-specific restriction endonuclease McrA
MRARFCHYCHRAVEFGAQCQCAAAVAARKARSDHQHENQRSSGRDSTHWRHVRLAVLRRDNYRCRYCGRSKAELRPNEKLTVHLDPRLRGQHEYAIVSDCTTACSRCHGKLPKGR